MAPIPPISAARAAKSNQAHRPMSRSLIAVTNQAAAQATRQHRPTTLSQVIRPPNSPGSETAGSPKRKSQVKARRSAGSNPGRAACDQIKGIDESADMVQNDPRAPSRKSEGGPGMTGGQ